MEKTIINGMTENTVIISISYFYLKTKGKSDIKNDQQNSTLRIINRELQQVPR